MEYKWPLFLTYPETCRRLGPSDPKGVEFQHGCVNCRVGQVHRLSWVGQGLGRSMKLSWTPLFASKRMVQGRVKQQLLDILGINVDCSVVFRVVNFPLGKHKFSIKSSNSIAEKMSKINKSIFDSGCQRFALNCWVNKTDEVKNIKDTKK